ncbi:uncharacterized protein LOC144751873 [Ciona intestinalis]
MFGKKEIHSRSPYIPRSNTETVSNERIEKVGCLKAAKLHRFANVVVNETVVSALVDSGSTITLLRADVLHTLFVNKKLDAVPRHMRFVGPSDESVTVLGVTRIPLSVGGLKTNVEVFVSSEIAHKMILGLDFLENNHCKLCYRSNLMSVGESTVPLLSKPFIPERQEVYVTESIDLPSMTEIIINGTLEHHHNDDGWPDFPVLVERNDDFGTRYSLLTANCVVTAKSGIVPVRIANFTNDHINIPSGVRIAAALPLSAFGKSDCYLPETCVALNVPGPASNSTRKLKHSICTLSKSSAGNAKFEAIRDGVKLGDKLKQHQKDQVWNLLRSHERAFSTSSNDLGQTSLMKHDIDTGDANPIRLPPRRTSYHARQQIENIIIEMKEQNLIRHSTSPWSSPIVLVKKKSGEMRFCVDYRRLNDVSKKNSYPIPRVDDSLDEMSGSVYFSTLDLKSGYWQIPMDHESREKTAFSSHVGLYEFNVMPMGLSNSAATFQNLMRIVLNGIEWNGALAYLDDIIVYGRTFDEHIQRLDEVLGRIEKAGLTLKPTKCDLFGESVNWVLRPYRFKRWDLL